jgi:hypothetical protein
MKERYSMRSWSPRSRVGALVATAVVALAGTGFSASPAFADAGTDGDGNIIGHAESLAVEVTPEQADILREALEEGEELSPEQALSLIGEPDIEITAVEPEEPDESDASPQSVREGEAERTLDCSTMYLWGNSYGHWIWENEFFARTIGPAQFGQATISTNGIWSPEYTVSFSGLRQQETGELPFVGAWANGTTVSAWSLNWNASNSPTLCYGRLTAYWG